MKDDINLKMKKANEHISKLNKKYTIFNNSLYVDCFLGNDCFVLKSNIDNSITVKVSKDFLRALSYRLYYDNEFISTLSIFDSSEKIKRMILDKSSEFIKNYFDKDFSELYDMRNRFIKDLNLKDYTEGDLSYGYDSKIITKSRKNQIYLTLISGDDVFTFTRFFPSNYIKIYHKDQWRSYSHEGLYYDFKSKTITCDTLNLFYDRFLEKNSNNISKKIEFENIKNHPIEEFNGLSIIFTEPNVKFKEVDCYSNLKSYLNIAKNRIDVLESNLKKMKEFLNKEENLYLKPTLKSNFTKCEQILKIQLEEYDCIFDKYLKVSVEYISDSLDDNLIDDLHILEEHYE